MTAAGLFIDGTVTAAADGREGPVADPSTGETFAEVALAGAADAERAVASARAAFDHGPWPRLTAGERGDVLTRLADVVAASADRFAELVETEAGAIPRIARVLHVDRPLRDFRDMARRGSDLADVDLASSTSHTRRVVAREPRGVVTAVTPWNFPHFLNLWKIAPALSTGNTMVLKPAPATPLVALELARCAVEAGVPPGVLNVVTGGPDVGQVLCSDPRVDMVTFTGSTAVGRTVAAAAAPTLKHLLLELGGKSAMVVLPDAATDRVSAAAMGFTLHSGQGCALMTRLVLPEALHDEVVERIVTACESLTVGSAHDADTTLGPLIDHAHLARVRGYVKTGCDHGARVATGGRVADVGLGGAYLEPTVLVDVDSASPVAQEEIFGPVLCVISYDGSEDEAVRIANDSSYGLAGQVWTADTERGRLLARRIRAGDVTVNDVHSSPDAPFGGYRQSGRGRECGDIGVAEYTEVKSIGWRPVP